MYNENIFKRLYNLFIDYKNYTNYTFSWMIKLIKIKKNDDTCRKNNKFHWAKKMHNAGNSYSVMILFIHPDITQCLLINRRARACWKKNCKFLQKKNSISGGHSTYLLQRRATLLYYTASRNLSVLNRVPTRTVVLPPTRPIFSRPKVKWEVKNYISPVNLRDSTGVLSGFKSAVGTFMNRYVFPFHLLLLLLMSVRCCNR